MIRELKRPRSFYERLFRLTAPIALQNLITFSLGLIDTLMVSQLGNNEMAAVKTANVPVFLLISIVFGVQSGVGILISQYWGKRDHQNISRAIGVAAGLGVGLALVIALALFFWPVQIMDLMSNEHQLSVLGAPYLRIIGFSYVFNMLSSIYVSAQRSVENSGFGMKLFGIPADLRQVRLSLAGSGGRGYRHAAEPRGGVCRVSGLRPAQQDHTAGSEGAGTSRRGYAAAVREIRLPRYGQ